MNKIKNFKYPKELINTIRQINKKGFEAYIVGGALRDILLDKIPNDYDITTDATPKEIKKIFKRVIETGITHGTVSVLIENSIFEITTFREDGDYKDFRRPEKIEYTKNIHEDLKRRDFTINALAYSPITDEFIDDFKGIEDLKNKKIKAIGDAKTRFSEDALRMLRAIRFSVSLGFEIEKHTLYAIKLLSKNLEKISIERIREEFNKILLSNNPKNGIELLQETNILKYIIPELENTINVKQNKYHIHDVYNHILIALDNSEKDLIIRLSVLLHDIAKPHTKRIIAGKVTFYNHEIIGSEVSKKILNRLKYPNKIIKQVSHLVKNHMFHYTNEWKEKTIKRFINRVGVENVEYLKKIRYADASAGNPEYKDFSYLELFIKIEEIIKNKDVISIKDLAINGNDIIQELKIKPSKKIKEILENTLSYVLENPQENEREILLKYIKNFK